MGSRWSATCMWLNWCQPVKDWPTREPRKMSPKNRVREFSRRNRRIRGSSHVPDADEERESQSDPDDHQIRDEHRSHSGSLDRAVVWLSRHGSAPGRDDEPPGVEPRQEDRLASHVDDGHGLEDIDLLQGTA